MKTEIFNRILCLVAEKTGVNEERLISLEIPQSVAKKPLIIVNNYRPLPRFRSGCKYC